MSTATVSSQSRIAQSAERPAVNRCVQVRVLVREPLPRRFWAKVQITADGCWLWTGAKAGNGYGSWGINGKTRSTHKTAYESLIGCVPDGLTLDHLCRVRHCCNPYHLQPVTQRENSARSPLTTAGRQFCRRRGSSFRTLRSGRRVCQPCRVAHQRQWRKQRTVPEVVPAHVHGTKHGYGYYKCRCELCRVAWRDYYRAYMAARRARVAA